MLFLYPTYPIKWAKRQTNRYSAIKMQKVFLVENCSWIKTNKQKNPPHTCSSSSHGRDFVQPKQQSVFLACFLCCTAPVPIHWQFKAAHKDRIQRCMRCRAQPVSGFEHFATVNGQTGRILLALSTGQSRLAPRECSCTPREECSKGKERALRHREASAWIWASSSELSEP